MAFREFCPSNNTEDKIMEHSLGVPKKEGFTTSPPRLKFYNHESQGWHGNHTHHFYAELENFGKGNVYSSSIMLVCVVLGLVITISGVTIILAKKAWRLQPRPPHRHCRRRYYRGDAEADQDSQEHSFCRRGIHCACSLRGYRFSSLHRLHIDAPPSYEECMGPGATQLYPPTEAPPPYSLTDTDSGHSSGGHQQAHTDLFTVSMDALPPYEAVCGPCPPPSLLPLPGSEPEPSSPQGPPSPKGSLASSPEMIV
ncbi:PREDICTED: protein BEAN1 isoform X2 [Myotis davidii]|uniref:protein BEAN1 isoform X2 n=1 Tax=Myotis davidii TaxID=225400 RepID=UPI000767DEE1|nr:PREDICTED: protein BEAN1 isoform X2 [Myotis davidii]